MCVTEQSRKNEDGVSDHCICTMKIQRQNNTLYKRTDIIKEKTYKESFTVTFEVF